MSIYTETQFAGSSPAMRTIFNKENDGFLDSRTDFGRVTTPKVRFPKIIRHQKAEVTTYKPSSRNNQMFEPVHCFPRERKVS